MEDYAVPQTEINPALAAGINYNLAAAPDTTIVDVVTKGIPTTLISGMTQLANSAESIADVVGLGWGQLDTANVVHEADQLLNTDMNAYYQKHQEGVDLLGFMGASLLPGTIGVKALHAAQKGLAVGTATNIATGLLTNTAEVQLLNRAKTVIESGASINQINKARVAAALARGGQLALEGIAFDMAVFSAMNDNPFLADMSAGDQFKHSIMFGALFGGLGAGWNYFSQFNKAFTVSGGTLAGQQTSLKAIETEVGTAITEAGYIVNKAAGPKTTDIASPVQLFDSLHPDTPLQVYYAGPVRLTPENFDHYAAQSFPRREAPMIFSADPSVAASRLIGSANQKGAMNELTISAKNPLMDIYIPNKGITHKKIKEAEMMGYDSIIHVDKEGVAQSIAIIDRSIIVDMNKPRLSHGDAAIDISKALHEEPFGPVRQELTTAVNAVVSRRVETLHAQAADLATRLSTDPTIRESVKDAITKWVPDLVASVFTGATRIERITADDLAGTLKVGMPWRARNWMAIDLETGAMATDPKLGAIAYGDVSVGKNTVAAGVFSIKPASHELTTKSLEVEGELLYRWGAHNPDNTFDLGTTSGVIAAYGALTATNTIHVITPYGKRLSVGGQYAAAEVSGAYHYTLMQDLMDGKLPQWFGTTDWGNYVFPTGKWAKVEYSSWQIPSAWKARGMIDWEIKVKAAAAHNKTVVQTIMPLGDLPVIDVSSVGAHDYRQSAGLMHSFNAAYESAMEAVSYVGSIVQNKTGEMREARAIKMLNAEQAIRTSGERSETSTLFNAVATRIRGDSDWWRIDTESRTIFQEKTLPDKTVSREVLLGADEGQAAELVYNYFAQLKQVDADYLTKSKGLDALTGQLKNNAPEDAIYLPPYDLGKTPYVVIVADPTGSKAMVRGRTAEDLQAKIRQIRVNFPDYTVYTSGDTKSFFKMKGEWEFENAFSKTSVNTALRNDGIMRDLDVKSGWQELDNINAWLTRKEFSLVRRAVSANYAQEFAEASALSSVTNPFHGTKLSAAGEAATPVSKLGADAYSTLISTALNVRDATAHPYWEYFNTGLNKLYEGTANALWDMGSKLRKSEISVADANRILKQRGVNDAAFTEELWALAAKPDFSTAALDAMARVRHILNTTVLRLDFFNPVVQTLGLPIMLMPAIRDATSEVRSMGDTVPMFKMMGTAVKNLFDKNLIEHYAEKGVVSKGLVAHANMIDSAGLIFKASSSARVLEQAGIVQSKFDKFINFFSKPTDFAEHAQRFISADIGRQIAEMRGLISGTPGYWAFISNFVAKVNGTYIAAQRPTLFTGIAGQAISVFQTYQFNLMQQFAKHIENGDKKTLALMLGLQGTIYGAASLPAFKVLNQQLLGEFNRDNADAYSISAKYLPETAGNFMMYGAASTLLGAALWSRGDVTPRTPTIVPITPQDTVAVSMAMKAGGALMDVLGATMGQFKEANPNFGVSIGEAIAHSGINRPLSGLAELALGARTSMEGKLDVNLRQQDVLSWATAVRLLGAKPLDEAIAMDAYNRQLGYRAAMRERTAAIGEALRSHALGTGDIPNDVIDKFAEAYTRAGGDIANFRSTYMRAIKDATVPRAVILAEQMRKSPAAKNYQWAMGADGELPSPDYLHSDSQIQQEVPPTETTQQYDFPPMNFQSPEN